MKSAAVSSILQVYCSNYPMNTSDPYNPDNLTSTGNQPLSNENLLEPGTFLKDRYIVGSPLGIGGFGIVYVGTDIRNNKTVAIKALKHYIDDYAGAAKRFEREIELCSQITSAHTIKIFDHGNTPDNTLYYVMEYLEGYTLEEFLLHHKRISFTDFKRIYLQILDALNEAHRKGIVHRDLKPANIWLTERTPGTTDFYVKVLDFGIAKLLDTGNEKLTQTGTWMGSPAYMSPEQLRGIDVTPASDIFALGLIAIEMTTGYQAFEADSPLDIVMNIMSPEPVFIDDWLIDTPIGQIISKCVQKDPAKRYPNAGALQNALSAISEDELQKSYVSAKMKRRTTSRRSSAMRTLVKPNNKRPVLPFVIGIVTTLAVVAVIFLLVHFFTKEHVPADSYKVVHIPTASEPTPADDYELLQQRKSTFEKESFPLIIKTATSQTEIALAMAEVKSMYDVYSDILEDEFEFKVSRLITMRNMDSLDYPEPFSVFDSEADYLKKKLEHLEGLRNHLKNNDEFLTEVNELAVEMKVFLSKKQEKKPIKPARTKNKSKQKVSDNTSIMLPKKKAGEGKPKDTDFDIPF